MNPFFKRNKKILYWFFFFNLWIGNFLYSNPTEGSVTAGSATITDILKTTLINQSSDKLILNWRDFSIASDETTRFIMPSASSSVLNRVTGGNLSSILGTLTANGNVYLINPNGVLMGAGANIQCNSFIASTLDISNDHFLAGGDLNFSGDSSAKITNLGKITASGGDVFLIARQIENYGEIRAENGTVGLASGSEILLKPAGSDRIFVKAGTLPSGTAIEQQGYLSGIRTELKAAGSLSSLAINNGGFIQATQVERIGGEVYLRAPKGKVRNTGTINAKGDQKGGKVLIEGNQIGIAGTIDVSGGERAGTLNIGGGFQGKDSRIENAQQVKISSEAKLFANNGNGEKSEEKNLVVWSDGTTEYYGAIEAKGSNVEISGKGSLVYQGSVDLGGNGSLLLDPQNLYISNANPGGYTNRTTAASLDQFTDNVDENSYITSTDLLSLLATGNVTLQANTDITFADNVDASGALYAGRNLTTNAGRSIAFSANIALTLNGGSYTATINDVGAQAGQRTAGNASFTTGNGSSITTNGGAITLSVGSYGGSTLGAIVLGAGGTTATISSGAGNINISGAGTSTNTIGIQTTKATIQSTTGNITLSGTTTSNGYAAYIDNGSIVTTTDGAISIAGNSQSPGATTAGLVVFNGSQIISTGTGSISLNGTGSATGTGGGASNGLWLIDGGSSNSLISTVNGAVSMNGTGGTIDGGGIVIANSFRINSTGTGSISMTGTGRGTATGITAGGTGQINSTGTGAVTITGNSGSGGTYGSAVQGGFQISTINGDVTINGTSNGTGSGQAGVLVFNGGQINSTGNGSITLNGTASATGVNSNVGLWLIDNGGSNTKISSTSGAINLNGTGGGSGSSNFGIRQQSGFSISSSGSSNITLSGSGAGNAAGISVSTGSNVIGGASATGEITLIANKATAGSDSISLANLSLQTTGKVNLKPLNDSTTIGVNTGATGDFNLSSTDLATITAGNSGIVIGKSTGTGAVDLRATTWSDGVTVLNTGTGASGITVNGAQTAAANKNLVLATTGGVSNAVGAGALAVSGTGKWLVYVPDAANGTATDITVNGATPLATLNGLSSKYLYNGTYATLAPTSITQTGNRYVFATAATLTFTANDAQKNYGEPNPNFTYSNTSGLLGTDTIANAFQGTLGSSSLANSVNSPIVLSNGTGASDLNYRFQFVNGNLKTVFNQNTSTKFQQTLSENIGNDPIVAISKITSNPPIFLARDSIPGGNRLVDPPSFDPADSNRYDYRIHSDYDTKSTTFETKTSDLKNAQEVQQMENRDQNRQDPEGNQILKGWYNKLLGGGLNQSGGVIAR